MRHGLDLGGLPDGLVVFESSLGVDKVRGEDGVDEGAFSQASLTNNNHVELEAPLEELVLDLAGDGVETDVGRRANILSDRHSWSKR